MKKSLLAFALLSFPFVLPAQVTDPAPYCSGAFDNENGASTNYISSVSIGTWENETGTTASSGGHYRYYNNVTAPVLTKGEDYDFVVSGNNANDVVGHFMAVYIDFNQDDDFDDAGERVMHYDFMALGEVNEATVTIPTTALTGITRMRVILFEDDDYTWIEGFEEAMACTVYNNGLLDWGETEDYNVNLQVAAGVDEAGTQPVLCYPNPATDKLFVQVPADRSDYRIYNQSGALLQSGVITSLHPQVNIDALPQGLYTIHLSGEQLAPVQRTFLKMHN